MMRRLMAAVLLAASLIWPVAGMAQVERPKLVVGIVVDQMRWDYLYRFNAHYGDGGFRRMMNEGYSFENCRIPYIPSVTAVGHTSIFTGSVPAIHGIAGNNFYLDGHEVYCTDDDSVSPVGSNGKAGLMSPHNMLATTIGDELRIATNNRSRVIGVSIKDRAAILPAGHSANGAFWFDDESGRFITSTFYMTELPEWVNAFNKQENPDALLSKKWDLLRDKASYTESTADDAPFENGIRKGVSPTLPLDLPALKKQYGYSIIRSTPMGNTLTRLMAEAAIEGEQLGRHQDTDMLTISFSCTDYLGHQVGTNALEIEDMYIRLDLELEHLFATLDEAVGKGQWTAFLTADHGAQNSTSYLLDRRIPAGVWSGSEARKNINAHLKETVGCDDLVADVMNYQVFFNRALIDSLGLDYAELKASVADFLMRDSRVLAAWDQEKTMTTTLPADVQTRAANGYFRGRSGDVQVILRPAFSSHGLLGTSHGVWNPYDTHIPLLFLGWGVDHGASTRPAFMTDIAATVCALLHIQAPDGCVGTPLFMN